MGNNTVEYWPNKAKEEGLEWADAALENAKEQEVLDCYATSSRRALNFILWSSTPQGYKFWREIHTNLPV